MPRALLACLALAVALPSAASAQAPSLVRADATPHDFSLDGRYRLVSGQASVDRAVDAVCDALDIFTRVIARPILSERNQPYRTIELHVDANVARFSIDGWGTATRLGATRHVNNERGEAARVRQRLVDGRLVQTLSTDEGTRRNVFTLSADGRRLTLESRVTSPRLPIPMRFRMVYERVPGPRARVATR